ncbi:heavy metal-associated isoprenylated plant protein 47-like isoform X1 [Vicia villosa]|uniref:heavy metal-associated isoprenylated plant protein 47-like isoform X1 n=1 Tax=Vicia villosa TaxID=3911 RepID=UPI00273A8B9E|nr:heavy metal-associated isoprenylated plant protein 47-like isoform X1 [Vicia villosa]
MCLCLCLQQKIVMKVSMNCQKCRTKALKVVASANGVSFVGLEGDEKDKLLVIGDGVDAVKLANCLRKKVGHTQIESLGEVKAS